MVHGGGVKQCGWECSPDVLSQLVLVEVAGSLAGDKDGEDALVLLRGAHRRLDGLRRHGQRQNLGMLAWSLARFGYMGGEKDVRQAAPKMCSGELGGRKSNVRAGIGVGTTGGEP